MSTPQPVELGTTINGWTVVGILYIGERYYFMSKSKAIALWPAYSVEADATPRKATRHEEQSRGK